MSVDYPNVHVKTTLNQEPILRLKSSESLTSVEQLAFQLVVLTLVAALTSGREAKPIRVDKKIFRRMICTISSLIKKK